MSRRTLSDRPYPRWRRGATAAAAFVLVAAALASAGPASAARPAKPKDLRVVSASTETVILAWKRTARRFAVSKGPRRQAVVRTRFYAYHDLGCGRSFRFGVRAINRAGRASRTARIHARTRPCPPVPDDGPPASVHAPGLSGIATAGAVLSTSNGTWGGAVPMTYAHEWLRCDSAGAACAPISGAASSTYPVSAEDVGSRLRARVTATNDLGSASATSAATGIVGEEEAPPPPPPPPPPTAGMCNGTDITYTSTAPGSTAQIAFDLGASSYPCGRFANGDWYVVGPAVIRQITPAIVGSGASLRHGVDVNPAVTSGNAQRWDGRLEGVQSTSVSFPYTAQPGESVVKYVSNNPGGACPDRHCGRFAAVLTVLASAPASPETTFRPPYWGSYKPLLSTSSLDLSLLRRLSSSAVPAKIGRSEAIFRTAHFRLDNSPSSVAAGGELEPVDAFHEGNAWGANVLRADAEVALWLMLDNACAGPPCSAAEDQAAKLPVLIGFVQNGIDLWGGTRGGLNHNRGGGGNAAGKLFLEVYAATALESSQMASDMAASVAANQSNFWETHSLYRGVNGKALWGQRWHNGNVAAWEQAYWEELDACSNCNTRDPYGLVDGGARPGTSYQRSTMLPTKYMALVLRLLPQTAAYWPGQHETVITDYADRVVATGALTIPDTCATKEGTYGEDYGPDGDGGCIRHNQGQNAGRVPDYNGTTVDGEGQGARRSVFGDQMWDAYR
jgi:hypothetical protein